MPHGQLWESKRSGQTSGNEKVKTCSLLGSVKHRIAQHLKNTFSKALGSAEIQNREDKSVIAQVHRRAGQGNW